MRKILAVVGASLLGMVGAANAAVDASVTTALTTAATDAGTIYVALVAVAVVGVGFLLAIKLVKKIPRMG
jgi:hypothetical protein